MAAPVPRWVPKSQRKEWLRSDQLRSLTGLSEKGLSPYVQDLNRHARSENESHIKSSLKGLAQAFCRKAGIPPVKLRFGGPRALYGDAELYGDYDPNSQTIRMFLYTPRLKRMTKPKTLMNTLLHELMHHYDVRKLGLPNTHHTEGFYVRLSRIYKPLSKFLAEAPSPPKKKQAPKKAPVISQGILPGF